MTESLLSRLSSLTEPSREIDAEIALADCPWLKDCPRDDRDGEPGWMTKDGRVYAPRYTESLDAALTLVPEGLGISIGRPLPKYCNGWYAELFAEGWGNDPNLYWSDGARPRGKDDYRSSPAIALLIALEKAKEESKP